MKPLEHSCGAGKQIALSFMDGAFLRMLQEIDNTESPYYTLPNAPKIKEQIRSEWEATQSKIIAYAMDIEGIHKHWTEFKGLLFKANVLRSWAETNNLMLIVNIPTTIQEVIEFL